MIRALGIVALIPMMSGPLPQEEGALTIALCAGGEITIPLSKSNGEEPGECDQQGCHAGNCRQKGKRSLAPLTD